jgi:hypothetical protein
LGAAALAVCLTMSAPALLTIEHDPVPVDVAVLFVGPDSALRQKEVLALLSEGRVEYIITPASGDVKHRDMQFEMQPLSSRNMPELCEKLLLSAFRICESSHEEMLNARSMMEALGLNSAVLVSSPYHMRRLSIIAQFVFDIDRFQISYKPTRYERINAFWFFSAKRCTPPAGGDLSPD